MASILHSVIQTRRRRHGGRREDGKSHD